MPWEMDAGSEGLETKSDLGMIARIIGGARLVLDTDRVEAYNTAYGNSRVRMMSQAVWWEK